MKSFITVLVLALTLLAVSPPASAQSAKPISRNLVASPVSSAAYSELVPSTVKGLKGVSMQNLGNEDLTLAFGAAGSEVQQMVVPTSSTMPPVYYPLAAGYGTRISVISAGIRSSSGRLLLNLFYN